ncbi:MAG: hypothetical protein NZ879_08615, partial [Archaeoglobaceae archaeon]|nr:hypothetical protein [Archaeoglobaceae archaeon]MDW8119026.1 hypothetical protein [Archaeoglobaceae archaeon]
NKFAVVADNIFARRLRQILGNKIGESRITVDGIRSKAWTGIRLKPRVIEESGFFICSTCKKKFVNKESAQEHVDLSVEHPEICREDEELEEQKIADFELSEVIKL